MQIRRAKDTEVDRALHLLLARPGQSEWEVHQGVRALREYAAAYRLSLEHCVVAVEDDAIRSLCLLIDSPGRTSSVFLPPLDSFSVGPDPNATVAAPGPHQELFVRMLQESVSWARQRQIQFIQAVVDAGAAAEGAIFQAAGFEYLTCLLYMQSDLSRSIAACRDTPTVQWVAYDEQTHPDFMRVLADTYQQSRDCPALTGRRQLEDVLASHRGTGQFDPRLWLLARRGDEMLGLILLAPIPERGSMEIVYMGLLPSARGRGFGSALVRQAVEQARQRAILRLTVTVDIANEPAIQLYRRFGFLEETRRDAWICIE